MKRYVAYYRVSTDKQGIRGLGMDAQQTAVQHVTKDGELLASYREVETGRKKTRPELLKAMAHAKRSGATLIVAKLDRLARNVAFTAALMESGVEFICCDLPGANKFTIHVMAAMAEQEADAISIRTKAALAAFKARGGLLGADHPKYKAMSPEKRKKAQRMASLANQQIAKEAYADLVPIMREWKGFGLSLEKIADRLNQMGHHTRTKAMWSKVQVMRVLGK